MSNSYEEALVKNTALFNEPTIKDCSLALSEKKLGDIAISKLMHTGNHPGSSQPP
jgi:hypothetical protein